MYIFDFSTFGAGAERIEGGGKRAGQIFDLRRGRDHFSNCDPVRNEYVCLGEYGAEYGNTVSDHKLWRDLLGLNFDRIGSSFGDLAP